MDPARVWKTGEAVTITFGGVTVAGDVQLASANGRSLILRFEALLGGYAGTMPVLHEGGGFVDLLTHQPVELA